MIKILFFIFLKNIFFKPIFEDEVTAQVNILLSLKAEFKTATGQEWKLKEGTEEKATVQAKPNPAPAPKAPAPPTAASSSNNDLYEKVKNQAELVRTIKANKASKVFENIYSNLKPFLTSFKFKI